MSFVAAAHWRRSESDVDIVFIQESSDINSSHIGLSDTGETVAVVAGPLAVVDGTNRMGVSVIGAFGADDGVVVSTLDGVVVRTVSGGTLGNGVVIEVVIEDVGISDVAFGTASWEGATRKLEGVLVDVVI